MPDPADYDNQDDFMADCVPMRMDEGENQDQGVGACLGMWQDRNKAVAKPQRAWSTFTVKNLDTERREVSGIASTPTTDRVGDKLLPEGAKFTLPLPFLRAHNHREPLGHVVAAEVSLRGISIRAQVVKVLEPASLRERLDAAWAEIKSGLFRGLSVGFRSIEAEPIDKTDFGAVLFIVFGNSLR